jgi:hypothetical protein
MRWLVLSMIVIAYASYWTMLAREGVSGFANGSLPLQILGAVVGIGIILAPIVVLFMDAN